MTLAVALDDRISKCQKILDQDPNSQIFAALAEAFRKKGELDRAFRVCQNGLKVHPSYGSAHVVMAKINLDRGLYDWAEAEIKRAVELEGGSRATDLLLAEIAIYKGEFKVAIRLLKRLSESDPDNEQIKRLLSIAEKIPEEKKAMQREAAVASEPAVVPLGDRSPSAPSAETVGPALPAALAAPGVIQAAMEIPGLEGAEFINLEGLVVDLDWSVDIDANACGATLADLNHILTKELIEASFGKTNSILIENGQRVFYLINVTNGVFLFVGRTDTNLGGMRMKISDLIEKYKAE